MSATTNLVDLAGIVAAGEFAAAREDAKPALRQWIDQLSGLSDDELFWETARAIHESAIMQRFRGNHEDVHCRASAAHHEAKRRHRALGHDEGCRGDNIYSRAFREAWINQGYRPSAYPIKPCTCDHDG